jgi:hypothetical protein
MIPTTIPTAYKAKTTTCRGCVSSEATWSVRLRPPVHFRIVVRILDLHLHTDGNGAADDLIGPVDRATCDTRLDSLAAYSKARTDTVIG